MSKLGLLMLLILSLLTFRKLEARSEFGYKLGGNISHFSEMTTETRIGVTVGLGFEWKFVNNQAVTS